MPLTKLFQRRNSSQKDRKKSTAELSASDPVAEGSTAENCDTGDKRRYSVDFEETEKNTEPELEDRNVESSGSTTRGETSRRCSVPETSDLMERNKSRSLSLKESGTKLSAQRTRRRKCVSESSAFSSTDDEGFEDKIIQLRERDLEKVIGQCVDRLIRESILTAVKSVKVDTLYEDVIKSLSRSASESSESSGGPETVEQKLHAGSVTEYADLMHTFEEEQQEELDEVDGPKQQADLKESPEILEKLQSGFQRENDKKDGTEENLTCPESDSTSKDEIEDPETFQNCSNLVIEVESNGNDSLKSVENCESSTCQNQTEDIVANVEVCGTDQLDTFADNNNITNKDFQKNDVYERTKDCQEYNRPSEILNELEQNETAEDTMDCARQAETSVREELVDIKREVKNTEGYQADIEESISLHSVASESSSENTKDAKSYSRTISDDTVVSVDESNLGDTRKDAGDSPEPQSAKVGENAEADLMAMSGEDFSHLLATAAEPADDLGENLPEQTPEEEEKKVNWKVGYLHVKLPHKSRHKGLKVWKKRCVAIQPDEFASDDSDPCLVLSVYSGDSSAAKKHSASFWKSISCQKAVIYRSSSKTHPYTFTISDDKKAVIHLAADSEAIAQEWMAAIRVILWPPSPVVQLEKMLNGGEFEISIIDNEFSYHAGLLGMYGYLTITAKKLILVHPQQGFVIQEWYLNTIDKFQLIPQTRIEDVNKVLSMTTCSDSSTGKGHLLIFCKEAVSLLQAIASTIHQILTHHSKQEGGKYQKELEEIGAWLVADATTPEDYYKVPPRQVKSLLDIPNFIFNKPITPMAPVAETQKSVIDAAKAEPARAAMASETVADDFLNCSVTSFVGRFPGKSSDSELSDAYTPPRSPEVRTRREAKAPEETANA